MIAGQQKPVNRPKSGEHLTNPVFPPQIFVKSNQGDEETTKINYLTFIGTPVQATNMNDFKRVRRSCSPRFGSVSCVQKCLCDAFLSPTCRSSGRKARVTEPEDEMEGGGGGGEAAGTSRGVFLLPKLSEKKKPPPASLSLPWPFSLSVAHSRCNSVGIAVNKTRSFFKGTCFQASSFSADPQRIYFKL